MIRVLLADDQSLVRMGFRMILEAETDIAVVGEAGDGAAAVSMTAALRPDVVLMDVRMPGVDGIDATAAITAAGGLAKVLILTTYDLDRYVYAGLRAGASGFLLKDAPPADLLAAIRTVADGAAVLAPSTTRRLIDRFVPLLPDPERATRRDPGARGVPATRARQVQSRDRLGAIPVRKHHQNPRRAYPRQAQPPRPRASRRPGLRVRPDHTREPVARHAERLRLASARYLAELRG